MDVHGDEAIPANFLAGFEGIPSLGDQQLKLFNLFGETLERLSPDFQRSQGYEIPAPGAPTCRCPRPSSPSATAACR